MLCTIGEPERFEATALSDAVNTSARLEGAYRILGSALLISQSTYLMIENKQRWKWRYLGQIIFKGKTSKTGVYELLDIDPQMTTKLEYLLEFDNAIKAFESSNFDHAKTIFERLEQAYPFDLAVKAYLEYLENEDHSVKSEIPSLPLLSK